MTTENQTPRPKRDLPEWEFTVVSSADIAPHMRRVVLTAPELKRLEYRPGQALCLQMPLPEGGTGRRDYTIRALDRNRGELSIDFVLHGETPSPTWARTVRPGASIRARGPRGRTVIDPAAEWHLLLGDETGLPAILHMLEALPAGSKAIALLEVGGREDELPCETQAALSLEWLHRGPASPGASPVVLDRLTQLDFPSGRGQAYIVGETSNVRAQRHHLIARGFERSQIASEGYWRPGRIGGHDHVDD